MNQAEYVLMTDEQLKQHIVTHRDDQTALSHYAQRRKQKDFPVIANVHDDDFDEKLQSAIDQKLGNAATT